MSVSLLVFGFVAEYFVATETNGSVDIAWWKAVLQGAGVVFTDFIGFESAAPLAEELGGCS
jgi:amino acid transporter